MVMVDVDVSSMTWLAWSEGRHLLGTVLHSLDEVVEFSQWIYYNNSTISFEDKDLGLEDKDL